MRVEDGQVVYTPDTSTSDPADNIIYPRSYWNSLWYDTNSGDVILDGNISNVIACESIQDAYIVSQFNLTMQDNIFDEYLSIKK